MLCEEIMIGRREGSCGVNGRDSVSGVGGVARVDRAASATIVVITAAVRRIVRAFIDVQMTDDVGDRESSV
ncbi:hypothetical protein [Saliphagus infecundisoli]|uniref:Uncharacterized protein n=1 Tax=Saliphagus infecundisoli TaxID=1849069 RepID=A0ABD5QBC8_9EURY|nr:hypothetical protein [Saliphagus infecundisoli]